MKKNVLILLSMLMLTSCTDKSWRGVSGGDSDDDDSRMPVLIGMGDGVSYTKGTGAVDDNDGREWRDVDVYVYAFRKDAPFTEPAVSGDDCLIDGTVDDSGNLAGRRATYSSTDEYLIWADSNEEIYYPQGKTNYDFYAYYIDDMSIPRASIERSHDRISFPVTIDGSTDLMTGRAVVSDASFRNSNFSAEEKEMLKRYAFSSYTAKRGITPMLEFRHHLTRIRFEMYPAADMSNTVIINSIKVKAKTTGTFVAVSRDDAATGVDFPSTSTMDWLELAEADGSPLKQDEYHTTDKKEEVDFSKPLYERPHVQVGGSLLLSPDAEYEVELGLKELKGIGHTGKTPFSISRDGGFKAGHQYVVRLGIYGMMEIRPVVEIEPWGTGGRITVDEEDDFEATYGS